MRIGGSLFLIALGAILRFAVHTHDTHGFNVGTAGVILMIIGAVGLIVTATFMSMRRRTDVIHEGGPNGSRAAYVEPRETLERY